MGLGSSGSWDLIPSTYKGYFNIENQTYLGTADPNNPWSVFNYSIEVKSNGQVGYAKYNKATTARVSIRVSG